MKRFIAKHGEVVIGEHERAFEAGELAAAYMREHKVSPAQVWDTTIADPLYAVTQIHIYAFEPKDPDAPVSIA